MRSCIKTKQKHKIHLGCLLQVSLSGSGCSIHATCWEGPIPHPLSWDVIYCSMGYLRPLDPSSMVTFLFRVAGVLNPSQFCPGSGTFRVVPVSLDWDTHFPEVRKSIGPPNPLPSVSCSFTLCPCLSRTGTKATKRPCIKKTRKKKVGSYWSCIPSQQSDSKLLLRSGRPVSCSGCQGREERVV